MNILLISQCSKKALNESRRILDQFAERKGDRTWQTPISMQGLDTLRKMLKKTARRNTAVACHKIGGKNASELLWIVGNTAKFNRDGSVPTNSTEDTVIKNKDEDRWGTLEIISLISAIAALFHDFGKASILFQEKLSGETQERSEPYRHEWVSLRMFQAFVNDDEDDTWLQRLANVAKDDEVYLLDNLSKVQDHPEKVYKNPFANMSVLAKAIAWLIVSHHKLPAQFDKPGLLSDFQPTSLKALEKYLNKYIEAHWNSPQIMTISEGLSKSDNKQDKNYQQKRLKDQWKFKEGTPLRSRSWCQRAQYVAKRALKHQRALSEFSLDDIFSLHLARLVLMQSDHYFSSIEGCKSFRDEKYKVFANTDRETKKTKQQLDEHLIGVYRQSLKTTRILPTLKRSLPTVSRVAAIKKRSGRGKFHWQDKAQDLVRAIREQTEEQGFFGISQASTGLGKTIANVKLMYALANEQQGCRFSIALGLRTLTLQTGDALTAFTGLKDEDIAVMIGSAAVKKLHQLNQREAAIEEKVLGSESSNPLLEREEYIRYDGSIYDTGLSQWLERDPRINKLVNAPVLVCTIDHLIPSTEGTRGGKQIAPMLRLLTGDLVLDEPDDFGLSDLPALLRLCHWAGLLGSRVLLSSATLFPEHLKALFDAYSDGRRIYNRAHNLDPHNKGVVCAWFDEFNSVAQSISPNSNNFLEHHHSFIQQRVANLNSEPIKKRQPQLLPIELDDGPNNKAHVIGQLAKTLHKQVQSLHQAHKILDESTQRYLSVGLIRMANIDPLVALAKAMMEIPAPANTRIHYCVYHSQFPLIQRSGIEKHLDQILNRKDEDSIWQHPHIKALINRGDAKHHIFIVLGSPVTEVGRDHCYDWAIIEPSSMRSIIQILGRVLRHRNKQITSPNVLILQKNIRALTGQVPAYCKPGFETDKKRYLSRHDLADILEAEQYKCANSVPAIQTRDPLEPKNNLVDLEHNEVQLCMESENLKQAFAKQWLRPQATLTAELQRHTPFRKSTGDEDEYFLCLEDESAEVSYKQWHKKNGGTWELKDFEDFKQHPLSLAEGNGLWAVNNFKDLILDFVEENNEELDTACATFGAITLRNIGTANRQWSYTPELGFYREVE